MIVAANQNKRHDAVVTALLRAMKSPDVLAAEASLFRAKSRHDARRVMANYRTQHQLLYRVSNALFSLCNQEVNIFDLHVAISLLGRGIKVNKSLEGTPYYLGNKHIALRSLLVNCRYYRRFGFPPVED